MKTHPPHTPIFTFRLVKNEQDGNNQKTYQYSIGVYAHGFFLDTHATEIAAQCLCVCTVH